MLGRIPKTIPKQVTNLIGKINTDTKTQEKASYVRALRSSTGFDPKRKYAIMPSSITLPKDTFNLEEAKQHIEQHGVQPEETQELKISTQMPLDREDAELKRIEAMCIRGEKAVERYGYIFSAGLSILRNTPYQPMQNEGIKASVRVYTDQMKDRILNDRLKAQKELDARKARKDEYDEYRKSVEKEQEMRGEAIQDTLPQESSTNAVENIQSLQ